MKKFFALTVVAALAVGMLTTQSPPASASGLPAAASGPSVSAAVGGPSATTTADTEVAIADAALHACVVEALGLAPGDAVMASAVASLASLDCSDAHVTSLSGLESFTGLEVLTAADNIIVDVSPLAGLTKLRHVELQGNLISDLTPLAGLTSLNWLYLWNNAVVDLSPLAPLPPLQRLWVEAQLVWIDVPPMSVAMPNPLVNVDASAVVPLSTSASYSHETNSLIFPGGQAHSVVWRSAIAAVSGDYFSGVLRQSTTEKTVNIPDAALAGCVNNALGHQRSAPITLTDARSLTSLNCGGTGVSDLTGISDFTGLIEANFSYNYNLYNLSALRGLTSLQKLALNNSPVTDVTPLSGLTNLRWLYLWESRVVDISSLKSLTNLERLWAESQHLPRQVAAVGRTVTVINVTDLDSVSVQTESPTGVRLGLNKWRFDEEGRSYVSWRSSVERPDGQLYGQYFSGETSVRVIDEPVINVPDPQLRACLGYGPEDDVAVAEAQYKTVLNCANKGVVDTTGLEHFTSLNSINLSGNKITDVSFMASLRSPEHIDLSNNDISDLPSFGYASYRLSTLNLSDNHIIDYYPVLKVISLAYVLLRNQTVFLPSIDVGVNQKSPFSYNPGLKSSTAVLDESGMSWTFTHATRKNNLTWDSAANTFGGTIYQDSTVTEIGVPDSALKTCLNGALGQDADAAITIPQAESLRSLSCEGAGVVNLAGIEWANQLTELRLGDNAIVDLAPLAHLTQLRVLTLERNAVESVSALSGMSSLEYLYLWSNKIADISPLRGLKFLDRLWIEGQTLALPSAGVNQYVASGLRNLDSTVVMPWAEGMWHDGASWRLSNAGQQTLYWSSAIASRSIYGEYFSGSIEIWVGPRPDLELKVPDAALKTCINAAIGQEATAVLYDYQIRGIKNLTCVDSGISDLTGLSVLAALETLDLSRNMISDVSGLAAAPSLATLTLDENAVRDVGLLSEIPTLSSLSLISNGISDVSGLSPSSQLKFLNLSQNHGLNVDGIQNLSQLKKLTARSNGLVDISPLAGLLKAETYLDLNDNNIFDISSLAGWNIRNLEINKQKTALSPLVVGDIQANPVRDLNSPHAFYPYKNENLLVAIYPHDSWTFLAAQKANEVEWVNMKYGYVPYFSGSVVQDSVDAIASQPGDAEPTDSDSDLDVSSDDSQAPEAAPAQGDSIAEDTSEEGSD